MAIDTRFFAIKQSTAREVAEDVSAEIANDDARRIEDVSAFEEATAGHLAFLREGMPARESGGLAGAVVITTRTMKELLPDDCTALIVENPRLAFSRALAGLVTDIGGCPTAEDAEETPGVLVGRGASIGKGVEIGEGSEIGAGAVICRGVAIGRNCNIGCGAVLSHCTLEDEVRIGANAVIGSAGFGFEPTPGGPVQMPQVGTVTIGTGTAIGPGSCVARGTLGATRIGRNVMIDNLVHIAHNCIIEDRAVLAGQVGMAGGARIGEGAMLAGQVGVSLRVSVGKGAIVLGQSGVTKDVADKETVVGFPAAPAREVWKNEARLRRLVASDNSKEN